jgi:phosphoserine aminotransferase
MKNGYNIGKIMGLVNTIKGDLYLLENLCINEESNEYREKHGKRIVKEAEERLNEIYTIADNLEL